MKRKGYSLNMNVVRRNFKMKVRVNKDYRHLKAGTELESVTMRKGNFTGLIKGTLTKVSVPAAHADVI